jgi:CheY-like chemotaxis protein
MLYPSTNCDVYLVEDNPADVFLVEEALREHGVDCQLRIAESGDQAISWIEALDRAEKANCPDLILLDLNLPRQGGHAVLDRLRQSPRCGEVPVIVMTSSDAPQDRESAQTLGIHHFFRKPLQLADFLTLGAVVKGVLKG